jgi:hypothetical protein
MKTGAGRLPCEHGLEEAGRCGLRKMHLLATDASDDSARHGIVAVGRERTPEEVRCTRRFTELCPSTATLMRPQVGHDTALQPTGSLAAERRDRKLHKRTLTPGYHGRHPA